MLNLRTILHPTDFSPSAEAALPHALELARRHGAGVHVLHVTPVFGDDPLHGAFEAQIDGEAFYRRLRDTMDERMHDLLARHDTAGIEVRRVHSRGAAPGEVLAAYAASEGIDVVVMGTHGRRGVRRLLLGSVTQDVLHRVAVPVLAVPARSGAAASATVTVRRILAPVDFSAPGREAVVAARHLAGAYDAALDVLHVVDPVVDERMRSAGRVGREEAERDAHARAEDALVRFLAEAGGPEAPTSARHVVTGYPPDAIAAFAEAHGAGLVVIATHGRRGFGRFPLGSVAERVVRTAPCPVYVVRASGAVRERAAVDSAAAVGAGG